MRASWGVVLALGLVGCGGSREPTMGEAAPAFGSRAELTTLEGFAVGKWRRVFVPASDTFNHRMEEKAFDIGAETVTFSKGGKAALQMSLLDECRAHGTWKIQGDQIVAEFTDVDGKTMAQVEADKVAIDSQREGPAHQFTRQFTRRSIFGDGMPIEDSRFWLASECKDFPRLIVSEDGKGLEPPSNREPLTGNKIGLLVWRRLRE